MGDFLNKEEIDTLLSAVSTGRIPEKKQKKTAVPYNFKRPALVSKEQIRVLEFLHEDFLRSCGVKFSNHLRTTVEFEVLAIEQLTYIEFIASLAEPTYILVLDLKPLSGQIILEINPSLTFCMVDRLLGGTGKSFQEPRELTNIEYSIMDKVVNLIMESLCQTWQHVVPLDLKVSSRESNPQFVQIVSGDELVISITFRVHMEGISGIMNICYPVSTLKPVLPRLDPQRWASEKKKEETNESLKILQQELSDTRVEVVAELGSSEITLLDFLRLTPGDVISLNQSIDENLLVKIQGSPKFYAFPGRTGRRKAVQITSYFKEEKNNGR